MKIKQAILAVLVGCSTASVLGMQPRNHGNHDFDTEYNGDEPTPRGNMATVKKWLWRVGIAAASLAGGYGVYYLIKKLLKPTGGYTNNENSGELLFQFQPSPNTKLVIKIGDITEENVDAIVNAANSRLKLGTGVAGAIKEAAGSGLQKECNALPENNNIRCSVGSAVTTGAYNLRSRGIKKVIHAVGPKSDNPNKDQLLLNAYYNSLEEARRNNLRSIAFPLLSTGVFGCDIDLSLKKANEAINKFLANYPNALHEIRVVILESAVAEVKKYYEPSN